MHIVSPVATLMYTDISPLQALLLLLSYVDHEQIILELPYLYSKLEGTCVSLATTVGFEAVLTDLY